MTFREVCTEITSLAAERRRVTLQRVPGALTVTVAPEDVLQTLVQAYHRGLPVDITYHTATLEIVDALIRAPSSATDD